MMSHPPFTNDRDRSFFKALDRCAAAPNTDAYARFSDYVEYGIALRDASSTLEPHPCPWRNASEICTLLREAALEWCDSPFHQGATVKLFSQIGASYWASKLAMEHLSQFA
jgi:hypothetical protein